MKANVYELDGKLKKTIDLPAMFETPYRPDLILRAHASAQSLEKQPQGRDPMAGKRTTAYSWGPGRAAARVPRVNGSGTGAANQGAFAPMTVGGRLAHPPRSEKNLYKKVNKKEKALAFQSAIAATANPDLVQSNGHDFGTLESPVIVVDDKIQTVKKTKSLLDIFEALGLSKELERGKRKRIRAGKSRLRGRRYRIAKGLLIVGEDLGLLEAANNIAGVDMTSPTVLNIEHLAPGGHAGRLVVWTESAITALSQRK
jgi:large subunit ribosomal protein L4e